MLLCLERVWDRALEGIVELSIEGEVETRTQDEILKSLRALAVDSGVTV
jgi:hypothetical protein